MSIAVVEYKKKQSPLKRSYIDEHITEIPELSQTVTKYTLVSGNKIKRKLFNRLENICKGYDNVISTSGEFDELEKRYKECTMMTATPVICFKKCISMSGYQSQVDSFGVVMESAKEEAINACIKLCGQMRFVTLYEKEKTDLQDLILEKTGVCVRVGEYGDFKEKMCIHISDCVEFFDRKKNICYFDIEYFKKDYENNYSYLPMDEILNISIKESSRESYIKSKKVKIKGIKSKKWQLTTE